MTIALALILRPSDGTLLIARRRADAHLPNLWEFPGGKCRPEETPEACALRETLEETGVSVSVLEVWPTLTHIYPPTPPFPQRTVTLHPILCRAESGDARPLGSLEIAWVLPADLGSHAFPEANGPLLARLRTRFEV